MSQRHVGLYCCWILIVVFGTPDVVRGQSLQQQDNNTATQKANDKNQKFILLAYSVIERHERTKSHFNSTSENYEGNNAKYIPDLQELSANLHSLKPAEQAIVLRAINCLAVDATAAVCSSAIKKHESGQLSDQDWIDTLIATSKLIPNRMDRLFLSALEMWQEKYPHIGGKSRSRTQFRPNLVYHMTSSFNELASKSKCSEIASSAFHALIDNDHKQWSLLETSASRNLLSINPRHRLHGIELFSRLNPAWKGHQSRLKNLIDDPDKTVSRAATEAWLNSPSPNDHRRLLESLSADSDIEKMTSLSRIDSSVTADWGSIAAITKLASSASADVRKAAFNAVSRTRPHMVEPFIRTIENDLEEEFRQFALDQVPLRGWYSAGKKDIDWSHNSSTDSYFSLLADAGRDGLAITTAMQRLTEPFGFHPHLLYADLRSGHLRESQKLEVVARLLDSDPSLQATETAIDVLREIMAENQARKRRGYLGQAKSARELIARHAKRLSPIAQDLSSFIEKTHSTRLVGTLSNFGTHAKPSLDLLIKILEDDTQEWRGSRRDAIFTIRKLQHHGKPALDALLKVALDDDYSNSLIAALTFLDLGGDPAALMPKYALRLPVLVKIDPAELITIAKFKDELRSAVITDGHWDLLRWLGPRAAFLMPELKLKYKQLTPSPNYYSSSTEKLIELLPLLPSSQEAFLPICIEYLEKEPRSMRCRTALKTLAIIGDDQRLAESAVKSLVTSGGKLTRQAAKACYETLYDSENHD